MPTHSSPPVLEVRGICKRFSSVRALHNVSLTLHPGEVLAVVGENGAGKSTLMRIVAGIESPDAGEILVEGRAVQFTSISQSLQAGISLIHQELNLADSLSVAANIFLGREPRRFGFIKKHEIEHEAIRYLRMVGLDVAPQTIVGTLPVGKRQLVEIAKALSADARVLIMDEPTSSLSEHEAQNLMALVRDLRSRGVSILYISHRLREVEALADRVVVLRDGELTGELSREDNHRQNMVRLMIGREGGALYRRSPGAPGDVVLCVEGLRTPAFPRNPISLTVRVGEVVGLAGLVGAGRTELLTTLFGVTPARAGSMTIGALRHPPHSPREAIAAGIMLAPEDRRRSGLVMPMNVARNLSLATLQRDQLRGLRRGVLNRAAERRVATTMIDRLRIKTPSPRQIVRRLSGGNQQKVVLGKWLALEPKLLLLDEPTRGIDVGAKEEIYKLIEQLAARGVAVLFASSEQEEIMSMSDRALVMHDGRIAGELAHDEFSEQAIMRLATGEAANVSERNTA